MSLAIQLARRGRYTCDPNPRVGCVITKDKQVLAEGWHAVTGEAHAEIHALRSCDDASNSTVYITMEPCSHQGRTPPCVEALTSAKVKEVVIAMVDPNPAVSGSGIKQLEDSGVTVKQGLLEAEARKLNPGFIKRMTSAMPYVRCKMAMSMDARTALANGESQWISSVEARRDVHRLRAASSAILTSVDTVIKDDPLLNARDLEFDVKQPVRVIVDRQLKSPKEAKIFNLEGKTIIYTEIENDNRIREIEGLGADVVSLSKSGIGLTNVLSHLAKEYEINEVMIEAGATFSGAMIDEGLVNEVIIYMAPKLLGDDAHPLLRLNQIDKLKDAIELELIDVRQIGKDLRLTLAL